MDADKASQTALAAAGNRALHLIVDDEPPILDDRLALRLIGREAEDAFRRNAQALRSPELRVLRTLAIVRSRYAEDELHQAIQRGVGQYVILGAGFDSSAFRLKDYESQIKVFEVDHPATQDAKRAKLSEIGLEIPRNLTFAPVDFETEALPIGLKRAGFRSDRPTFFSWLGVTQYLTEPAILSTLHYVSSCGSGSEIVFEYCLPPGALPARERDLLSRSMERTAAQGEPFVSMFEPNELANKLRLAGFQETRDFGPREAGRYLAGRSDGLRFSDMGHLMWARAV